MNIGGIGNTGVDYSRYSSRQIEQQTVQQESEEQQNEQAVTVQQPAQPQGSGSNAQSYTETQSDTSSVSKLSGELAQTLQTEETDDEDSSEQALINKANSGSTLTQSELSRLKEADPSLYSRVVKAEKAREELRSQMEQNPSGAKQVAQSAISKNNSEEQEIVRRALADEYSGFASKYDQVELSGAARW